jgi:hypothetical protein
MRDRLIAVDAECAGVLAELPVEVDGGTEGEDAGRDACDEAGGCAGEVLQRAASGPFVIRHGWLNQAVLDPLRRCRVRGRRSFGRKEADSTICPVHAHALPQYRSVGDSDLDGTVSPLGLLELDRAQQLSPLGLGLGNRLRLGTKLGSPVGVSGLGP